MPELDTRARTASEPKPVQDSPLREQRIDPPHQLANGRDAASEVVIDDALPQDAELETASLAMVQQLRLQAQQLARHLGDQQTDLDRREAELLARLADLEQRERNNRLWLKDRHEDLSQRERELGARETQLQVRARQLEQSHSLRAELDIQQATSFEAREEVLGRREAELQRQDEQAQARLREIEAAAKELDDASRAHMELTTDLERRMSAFDARRDVIVEMISRFLEGRLPLAARPNDQAAGDAARFIVSTRSPQETMDGPLARDQFDELAGALSELHERRQRIAQTESLLSRAQSEVAELHQSLLAERKQFYTEVETKRRQHEEAEKRALAELVTRRETLETASQQLELRRAAIDQMRAELVVAQREALENRLAAEELMSRIRGAAPPAELSRQIAHTKSRLLESFRLQQQEIADERRQLEALAIEIGQQHERLTTQKRELEQWLKRQQKETEADAARMAQQEDELTRKHDLLEKQRFDWEHERQEYQREIRRLLAELGR
jgi:hypothetical protein